MTNYSQEWGDISVGEKTGAVLCADPNVRRLSEVKDATGEELRQLLLPLHCHNGIRSGSTLWNRVDLFTNRLALPEDTGTEDLFNRIKKSHFRARGLHLDCPPDVTAAWFEEISRVFQAEFSAVFWKTQVGMQVYLTAEQRLFRFEDHEGLKLPDTTGSAAYQCFVYEPPKPGSWSTKSKRQKTLLPPVHPLELPKKRKQSKVRKQKPLKIPALTDIIRPAQIREALHSICKGKCQYCGRENLTLAEVEVDHIIPKAIPLETIPELLLQQGVRPELIEMFLCFLPSNHDSILNYNLACADCNAKKTDRLYTIATLDLHLQIARNQAEKVLRRFARNQPTSVTSSSTSDAC